MWQCRAYLATLLPASQAALPARTMADSLLHGLIPIGSCPDTSLRYTSYVGGARLGRLLQVLVSYCCTTAVLT